MLAVISISALSIYHKVYGDGFTQESLPPASVGNRTVSVFIKINPPLITAESYQDRYLQFRWFDANTNQTIQHTTFLVLVTKGNQSLFEALFHTHTGKLTIRVTPSNKQSQWKVMGEKEPFLDGYMFLPQNNDTIGLFAPMLGEGGLYHIYMILITIDYDQNMFNPINAPKFDSYLSVGDISDHKINYHNTSYNSTLISYYDKINNYNFDPAKMQFSWTIPFDWNVTRFQSMPIFVHEELRIPKSFKEFTNTPIYMARINGHPITGQKIISDPYSLNKYETIHILLNKNDIENLAKISTRLANIMNFTVAPQTTEVNTSSSVMTDAGGWGIKLRWNPTHISANSQNNLELVFSDTFTEQKIIGDVNYDINILDKDGNTEFSKKGLIAKNGTDVISINIPPNGIYSLEINVKSIVRHDLIDTSRIGIARGNLVIPSFANDLITIPEFPISAEFVVNIITCLIILLTRAKLCPSF